MSLVLSSLVLVWNNTWIWAGLGVCVGLGLRREHYQKLFLGILLVPVLFHGGAYLKYQLQARHDAQRIKGLVSVEELILHLTPRLKALSDDLENLQLPGRASASLFAGNVTVKLTTLDDVRYVEQSSFKIKSGNFSEQNHDAFKTQLVGHALFRLRDGSWRSLSAEYDVLWNNVDNAWKIVQWSESSGDEQTAATRMFKETLNRAISDPVTLSRLRGSLHQDAVRAFFARGRKDPPHRYFAPISVSQKPAVSVVDIDGDGFDDLYVMVRIGKNMLLRNEGNGTFTEVAEKYGLDVEGHSTCGLFADFDKDGDVDLLLGRSLKASLYMANQDGQFVSKDIALPPMVVSMSAADYNMDGFLDVYFCTYRPALLPAASQEDTGEWPEEFLSEEGAAEFRRRYDETRGHAGLFSNFLDQVGPPNALFLNKGSGRFVPAPEGPQVAGWRNSLQATWSDYDEDGDPDLYLANDWAPDAFYRNDGEGGFVDLAHESGMRAFGFAMGASWGDYDRDGDLDVYVSNMYSKAGRRITSQVNGLNRAYAESAAGNFLWQQQDDRSFKLASGFADPLQQVARAGWSWGGQFADFDNDGWLDLYVLSGYFSAPPGLASEVDL